MTKEVAKKEENPISVAEQVLIGWRPEQTDGEGTAHILQADV